MKHCIFVRLKKDSQHHTNIELLQLGRGGLSNFFLRFRPKVSKASSSARSFNFLLATAAAKMLCSVGHCQGGSDLATPQLAP